MPVSNVTAPASPNVRLVQNLWWVTNAAGHVCFAEGRFPQANKSRSVAERAVGAVPGAAGITHLPVAYVPVDSRDLLHTGGHRHDAEVSFR